MAAGQVSPVHLPLFDFFAATNCSRSRTHIPPPASQDTEFGLLVFIGFFFFAAINPGTGKFVEDEEEEEA